MRFNPADTRHLFHGTAVTFDGRPTPGGYDSVLWTAQEPEVALAYLPSSGIKTGVHIWQGDDAKVVQPSRHSAMHHIAKVLGRAAYDVEYGPDGRARSWRYPQSPATEGDVRRYIEDVLGYEPDLNGVYMLATELDPATGEFVYLPADYREPGSLYVLEGFKDMKFFVMATGESDLTDLQYNRTAQMRQIEAAGYDGVVIDDFLQSENWGNVGHRSIGFFKHAADQLSWHRMDAKRLDWREPLSPTTNAAFLAWSAAQKALLCVGASEGRRYESVAP